MFHTDILKKLRISTIFFCKDLFHNFYTLTRYFSKSFTSLCWLWIIIVVAVVLLIIALIVIVVVVKKKKKDEEEEPLPPPAAEQPPPPAPMPPPQPMVGQAQPMMPESGGYEAPPPPPPDGASPYQVPGGTELQPPPESGPQGPSLALEPTIGASPEEPVPQGLGDGAPVGFLPPSPGYDGTTYETKAVDEGDSLLPPPDEPGAAPADVDNLLEPSVGLAGGEEPAPPPSEQVPEELQIACHACGEVMEVTITERPVTIQCWNCSAEGLIE